MPLSLVPMSPAAFGRFRLISLQHHAEELIAEEHFKPESAAAEAESELNSMLPKGLQTPNNYLFSILANNADAGYLWFLTEQSNGIPQAFLCDFYIVPNARRKGYGQAALEHFHNLATQLGCRQCVLFLSSANPEARRLYERCGYDELRPHNYGRFMRKILD